MAMQIESQNYVLEDPQFGTSSQAAPTDSNNPVTAAPYPQPISVYLIIGIGVLLFAIIGAFVRRKHQQ